MRKGNCPTLEERDYVNCDGSVLPVMVFPSLEAAGADGSAGGVAQHLITTRMGGVSSGIFASMNLSFGRGDDDANVKENIARVAAAFGTDPSHMVFSHQVHETNVRRVTAEDAGMGLLPQGDELKRESAEGVGAAAPAMLLPQGAASERGSRDLSGPGRLRPMEWASVDGMVTNEPGLVLGTFYADCVPLLFVDPVRRAVGVSHSGWRGTVGRIGAETLEVMHREFGTDPADVLVGIGPSICQDHYEVSEDVAERFREEFPEHVSNILRYDGKPGHQQLDLWEACRVTLLEAGVPADNISVTDICTCCNPQLLFSHRASHGRRGNIGAFIMLR